MLRESTTAASVLVPIVSENRFPSLDQAVPNSDSPLTAIPTAPRIAARKVEGIELALAAKEPRTVISRSSLFMSVAMNPTARSS
jgi:hypothetical protein